MHSRSFFSGILARSLSGPAGYILRHRRASRSEPIVHALQVVPRPTPPSSARASRLLRARVPSAWRPSRPRGPAPAVHACPRQRLGLGRSALVGDVAAAARREPRRRPDGKSVRSCESSPGAVCCVLCNTVRSHSFGLWCGPP